MREPVIKGWKLFRKMKSGSIRSLFIHNKIDLASGVWLEAGCYPTKGFAVRPGWHVCKKPEAPHLTTKGRVWREVEMTGIKEFSRPECQGGTWLLASRMKILPAADDQGTFDL